MIAPKVIGIDASRSNLREKTGTEWYSRNIISALAELECRPHLRLYYREETEEQAWKNTSTVWIRRRRLWTHVGLSQEMRRSPIDALFVPAHVIPRTSPRATVVTVHDIGFRYEPGAHTLQRRVSLEAATRWNVRAAGRVIVPSRSTANDLERDYGLDRDAIDIIPHGVDHDRYRILSEDQVTATLAKLGVRRPYLLFLSTVQPRKNLSRIVSAFESIGVEDLQLVVAGATGWKSEGLLNRMAMSERAADILHIGFVPDDAVPALYNGAAAFILPSLYEGFGMGVLEAMACGCPVVTSSTSSLADVAGGAAVIVDPTSVRDIGDGIGRALVPATAVTLREQGLERAKTFTWERAAAATLASIIRAFRETRE